MHKVLRIRLPASHDGGAVARTAARAALEGTALTDDDLDDVELVTSELFANAVEATTPPADVDVSVEYVDEPPSPFVTVRVSNTGDAFQPPPMSDTASTPSTRAATGSATRTTTATTGPSTGTGAATGSTTGPDAAIAATDIAATDIAATDIAATDIAATDIAAPIARSEHVLGLAHRPTWRADPTRLESRGRGLLIARSIGQTSVRCSEGVTTVQVEILVGHGSGPTARVGTASDRRS